MNDDNEDDIDIQIEAEDYPEEENPSFDANEPFIQSLSNKLFYLKHAESNKYLQMFNEYPNLSDSPLTMSGNTSPREDDITISSRKKTYQKLTFEEIEYSIQKHFKQEKHYVEMDILITFIKGQKHIFSQSYNITQQKVHLLVFPCLMITSIVMIIAPIIQEYPWSGYLLTGLNAILTLFISILNFWNLQQSMIQYNTCANHFDRLETSLVMTRNQMYLLDDNSNKTEIIIQKLRETENRMMEIKESISILIPNEVQDQTPLICHFDIFAFIHKMEQKYKIMIMRYKDIKNEIRYIMFKWKTRDNSSKKEQTLSFSNHMDNELHHDISAKEKMSTFIESPSLQKEHERQRLLFLIKEKEIIKNKILANHERYNYIDQLFSNEIQISERNQNNFFYLWFYYLYFFKKRNVIISIDDIFKDDTVIQIE
jgi:hypothetical protein